MEAPGSRQTSRVSNRFETSNNGTNTSDTQRRVSSARPMVRNTDVCRDFLRKRCIRGSKCRFLHDESRIPPSRICRNYLRGSCTYEADCRFFHLQPENPSQSQEVGSTSTGRDENQASSGHAQTCIALESRQHDGGMRTDDTANVTVCTTTGDVQATEASRRMKSKSGGLPRHLVTWETPVCLMHVMGLCPPDRECEEVHGNLCPLCRLPKLHPRNEYLRRLHLRKCDKRPRGTKPCSQDRAMTCGICMEYVLNKDDGAVKKNETKFGILQNCAHCFCYSCIMKWRRTEDGSMEMQRTCPICRTPSDFVMPRKSWVYSPHEKAELIAKKRTSLKSKHCRRFQRGEGYCPSGKRCVHLHALPDGSEVVEEQRRQNESDDTELVGDSDDETELPDVFIFPDGTVVYEEEWALAYPPLPLSNWNTR